MSNSTQQVCAKNAIATKSSDDPMSPQVVSAILLQADQARSHEAQCLSSGPSASPIVSADDSTPQNATHQPESGIVVKSEVLSPASGLSTAVPGTVQALEAAIQSCCPASLMSAIHAAVKHLTSEDAADSSVPEVSTLDNTNLAIFLHRNIRGL